MIRQSAIRHYSYSWSRRHDQREWVRQPYTPPQPWLRKLPPKPSFLDRPLELSEGDLLAAMFAMYVQQWRTESEHLSSIKVMTALPSYRRIVGMGQPIVKLLLMELKDRPNFWFTALREITGEDEIGKGCSFKEAVAAWLKWGHDNHYLHEGTS
jgi:hypothetical protein